MQLLDGALYVPAGFAGEAFQFDVAHTGGGVRVAAVCHVVELHLLARQREHDGVGFALALDGHIHRGAGLATQEVAYVVHRQVCSRPVFNGGDDVAGAHALLVATGSLDRRDDGDLATAPAYVEAHAAVAPTGDDAKVRVICFVDEGGVRVELAEHRLQPGPHQVLGVERLHVAGDEFLVSRTEDLEVLAEREEVIVARHPEAHRRADDEGEGESEEGKFSTQHGTRGRVRSESEEPYRRVSSRHRG